MTSADPREALTALARVLAPLVAAELRANPAEPPTGLVAVDTALGVSRRHAAELCRSGRVAGASLIARRWRAPLASIDAYRVGCRRGPATEANDNEHASADDVAAELAALGLRRVVR